MANIMRLSGRPFPLARVNYRHLRATRNKSDCSRFRNPSRPVKPDVHRRNVQKPVDALRSHPKGSSSRGVQTLVSTSQDRAPIGQHRDSAAENERVVPAAHAKKKGATTSASSF